MTREDCSTVITEMLQKALEHRVLTSLAPYFEKLRECLAQTEPSATLQQLLDNAVAKAELTLRISGGRGKEEPQGRDLYIPSRIGELLFPRKWRTPDKIRARVYLVEAGGKRYLVIEGE